MQHLRAVCGPATTSRAPAIRAPAIPVPASPGPRCPRWRRSLRRHPRGSLDARARGLRAQEASVGGDTGAYLPNVCESYLINVCTDKIRDKISYLCTDEPRTTGFPSSDTSAVSPSEKIEHLRSESPTRDKIRLSYLISYQQRRSASGHTRTRAWARSCPTRGLVLRARAC